MAIFCPGGHVHVRSCTEKRPAFRPLLLPNRPLFAVYTPYLLGYCAGATSCPDPAVTAPPLALACAASVGCVMGDEDLIAATFAAAALLLCICCCCCCCICCCCCCICCRCSICCCCCIAAPACRKFLSVCQMLPLLLLLPCLLRSPAAAAPPPFSVSFFK